MPRPLGVWGVALVAFFAASTTQAAPLTGNTGPGGFSLNSPASSLRLWLQGDSLVGTSHGAAVGSWDDSSPFDYDVTGANTPTFNAGTPGVLNGRPAVVFNHNPQPPATSTFLQNATVLSAGAGNFASQNATMFEVYVTGTLPPNDHFALSTTGTAGSGVDLYQGVASYNNDFRGVRIEGVNTGFPNSGSHIKTVVSNNPNNTWQLIVDGAQLHSTTQNWGLNSTYAIGRNATHGGSSFLGQIGEAIIFNEALNQAERAIVENYLSSKYAIGINTSGGGLDKYAGDAPGLNYDHNVFGVGRVNATNQVTTAGGSGFGFEVTAGSNPDDLNDGEFLLAGHGIPLNDIVTLESLTPATSGERWARVWNVDTNGGTMAATFAFNFDDAGLTGLFDLDDEYSLLYSADPVLDDWVVISDAPDFLPGDTIAFDLFGYQLQSGFYTLGINVGTVPEPGTGLLLTLVLVCGACRRRQRIRSVQ